MEPATAAYDALRNELGTVRGFRVESGPGVPQGTRLADLAHALVTAAKPLNDEGKNRKDLRQAMRRLETAAGKFSTDPRLANLNVLENAANVACLCWSLNPPTAAPARLSPWGAAGDAVQWVGEGIWSLLERGWDAAGDAFSGWSFTTCRDWVGGRCRALGTSLWVAAMYAIFGGWNAIDGAARAIWGVGPNIWALWLAFTPEQKVTKLAFLGVICLLCIACPAAYLFRHGERNRPASLMLGAQLLMYGFRDVLPAATGLKPARRWYVIGGYVVMFIFDVFAWFNFLHEDSPDYPDPNTGAMFAAIGYMSWYSGKDGIPSALGIPS